MANPYDTWYLAPGGYFGLNSPTNSAAGKGQMVDFDGTYLVAVGIDNTYGIGTNSRRNSILYSTDGTTWNGISCFTGANLISSPYYGSPGAYAVANGNANWVVVGISGLNVVGASLYYASSSNMRFWNPVNPFSSPNGIGLSVAYGNGKWVAVGQKLSSNQNLFYADDSNLSSWQAVSAFGTGGKGNAVIYDLIGNWFAVGTPSNGGNNFYSSPDGVNWTGNIVLGGGNVASVAYGNGIVVVTGTDGLNTGKNTAVSSDGGATWTSISQFSSGDGHYVTFQNNIFMVGGYDTSVNHYNLYKSTDGTTWTPIDVFGTGDVKTITYRNGVWVAGGYDASGGHIKYSTDTTTWTTATTIFDSNRFNPDVTSITYGLNNWYAVSNINDNGYSSSIGGTRNFTSPIINVPPQIPCFKQGTRILTSKGYEEIENLQSGDLVKTIKHGFVPIHAIGKRVINNQATAERIKNQLYVCSSKNYPEVTEDLVITGCHSILIPEFENSEQRSKTKEILGEIYVTDGYYRLPACVDKRASVYDKKEEFIVYHLALEHDNYYINYGIYANGLLVETTSKRYLLELSGMTILENPDK